MCVWIFWRDSTTGGITGLMTTTDLSSLFFLHHVIFVFTLCASLRNTLVFLLYLQLYHLPTPDNAKKELPSLPLLWTELFSFYFIFLSFISFHKFDTFGGSSKQNILFSFLLLINNGWVGQVFLFTWKEWEIFFFFFWGYFFGFVGMKENTTFWSGRKYGCC